jgi:hypothetical protein
MISSGRHLLQVPSSCATQGVICDQDTIATASILTYTGNGLAYNGVPLVQSPVSKTLLLSSDPACTVPGGDKITFPPAILSPPSLLEGLQPYVPYNWHIPGTCRVDSESTQMYCPDINGAGEACGALVAPCGCNNSWPPFGSPHRLAGSSLSTNPTAMHAQAPARRNSSSPSALTIPPARSCLARSTTGSLHRFVRVLFS